MTLFGNSHVDIFKFIMKARGLVTTIKIRRTLGKIEKKLTNLPFIDDYDN
jgi:hypothetical protein